MTSTYRHQVTQEIDKIPAEYLPTILQVIRAFRESVTLKSAEASFRQGWQEALDGDTHPVSELWTELDAE
jgi:hypothetical protein